MEAELDATLGYEKNQKGNTETTNKRNGHSPKKLKSQYGEFQIDVPQYRKVTKTKRVFPSDISLEKMLYLASRNVTKKWTQRYRGWDQVLRQLTVLYGERLTQYL